MKQSTKATLIASISTLVGIAVLIGVGVAVTTAWRTIDSRGREYSTQVQTLEAAQKSYTAGQTAELGPYDVTVSSTQKGYTPTETEAAEAQDSLDKQYVRVTLAVTYNSERSGYDALSTNTGDWISQLSKMTLNDTRAAVVTPDVSVHKAAQEVETATKTANGGQITLLYRVPKATDTFTLKYDISIFTKVSPLVGTEGMPRKPYEYTIGIQ